MKDTLVYLGHTDFPSIRRRKLETLQLNLGYLCNQQCLHCHVDASPRRTEIMQHDTIQSVLKFIDAHAIRTVDLTGGAPEMNPHFRELVTQLRQRDVHIMDRCNLTIVCEPGYEWLADFLAANHVEVIASMPCYLQENVDAQRGKGVFDDSIKALQKLNALGYGDDDNLKLSLVYNPQGPSLPPAQQVLEQDYKNFLLEKFGIRFNSLFTLANMPIKRFGSTLLSKGLFNDYMQLLKTAYQQTNLDNVMCKTLISVDWQGFVYDCDFNQMLGLKAGFNNGKVHLRDLMSFDFNQRDIVVMDHCYGCTAGQGSSCGGSLT
ncbi:MAG: arsenosugar biosynthesis radical SAM (seleno)protein ArsS [Gammaproteobacteria bacterium]